MVEADLFNITKNKRNDRISSRQEPDIESIRVVKIHSNSNGIVGCPTESILPNMLQPDALMRSYLADRYNNAKEHFKSNIHQESNNKIRCRYAKIYVKIFFRLGICQA